jgi:chromosome segregation ATPase
MMRDDMLVKLEEEKAAVEGKLKWKTEQFRHLEDALKKVQDDFKEAKREWGADRSNLVDRIIALETELDSKTRIAEDFRSRLEMCSQALSGEEGRRKRVEAEMSELRHMYGNVVSEFEVARSTIESLTAKRDAEIAALRGTLAEKATILKEMGYSKAHLEQENEDLRSSLKEYQEAQIGGADAVVSLKDLREKLRALEHTHRSCTGKLRDKESEWRIQMEKLGSDLDGCLSKLDSRDILVSELQDELQRSNRSLEQQTVESWEASVLLAVLQSKLHDSCSYIDTIKVNMQHHYENLEKESPLPKSSWKTKTTLLSNYKLSRNSNLRQLQNCMEELRC